MAPDPTLNDCAPLVSLDSFAGTVDTFTGT